MTTIEQLVGISAQQNEIVKRVGNGSLDPAAVKRALQDIIEGKLPALAWNPPAWWRTPDQQLAKARELWPDATLPEPPASFVPQTKTEVLLLHVPDSFNGFDTLWEKVVAPEGYTKTRWDGLKPSKRDLRLAPNVPERTAPVWLAFDPEHGKGERPDKLWGQANLAASEVFSAMVQFPEWVSAWFNGASAPNLSGYQLKYDGSWSRVPFLRRWDGSRELELGADFAGSGYDRWASPSVREC